MHSRRLRPAERIGECVAGASQSTGLPHLSMQISIPAPASCVGRDLEAVSAQSHAALTPRPPLAGVEDMQYALSTLADTVAIYTGE